MKFRPHRKKASRQLVSKSRRFGLGVVEPLEDRRLLTLLGVLPDVPVITFNSTGVTTYTSATENFDVTATPLRFRETAASPLRLVTGARNFEIHIQLDSAGNLVGGTPGDDFTVSGTIDIDGDGNPDVSGVLLTGEVIGFGYEEDGATDQFDFLFTPTGGALASYFAGQNIGINYTSENSTFNN